MRNLDPTTDGSRRITTTSTAELTYSRPFEAPGTRCLSGKTLMPVVVTSEAEIVPGDIYEDTFYHPCLCIAVQNKEVTGISLVDGSYPRAADIGVSDVRKLTSSEAWHWRLFGPVDRDVP